MDADAIYRTAGIIIYNNTDSGIDCRHNKITLREID